MAGREGVDVRGLDQPGIAALTRQSVVKAWPAGSMPAVAEIGVREAVLGDLPQIAAVALCGRAGRGVGRGGRRLHHAPACARPGGGRGLPAVPSSASAPPAPIGSGPARGQHAVRPVRRPAAARKRLRARDAGGAVAGPRAPDDVQQPARACAAAVHQLRAGCLVAPAVPARPGRTPCPRRMAGGPSRPPRPRWPRSNWPGPESTGRTIISRGLAARAGPACWPGAAAR